MLPKSFKTFAEFEREIIRPSTRIGMTFEEIVDDEPFENELDFDRDEFDDDDDGY